MHICQYIYSFHDNNQESIAIFLRVVVNIPKFRHSSDECKITADKKFLVDKNENYTLLIIILRKSDATQLCKMCDFGLQYESTYRFVNTLTVKKNKFHLRIPGNNGTRGHVAEQSASSFGFGQSWVPSHRFELGKQVSPQINCSGEQAVKKKSILNTNKNSSILKPGRS